MGLPGFFLLPGSANRGPPETSERSCQSFLTIGFPGSVHNQDFFFPQGRILDFCKVGPPARLRVCQVLLAVDLRLSTLCLVPAFLPAGFKLVLVL